MKIRLVLMMVPLFILALALAGGFVLVWRLFSLFLLVLLLGYFWVRLSIRGLEGKVEKSVDRCQVGQWFDEEISVGNSSKIPKLLLKVQENTNLPGYRNVAAFNLRRGSSHHWQPRIYCQRRGLYSLGALTATATDLFGLFSRQCNLSEPQNVLIYPKIVELPFFEPIAGSELVYAPSTWLMGEISLNAARVRDYVNGDRLDCVHWPSTAHTGKLMVKEFDPDRSSYAAKRILIVPDMHEVYQQGDGADETTEEYGIAIAASLIKKYIDSEKQVGLIASGDQPYLFPPQTGNQHLWEMVEALALMKATGKVPVEQLILSNIEYFGVGSVIILITPSSSERLLASLHRIKNRGAMVVTILLDSLSFGGRVSSVNMANGLIASGLQVYLVRRGEELSRALDSRVSLTTYRRI